MKVNPCELTPYASFLLFSQAVTPRPVALITSLDENGIVNVAPYNPFVVDSGPPPVIAIAIGERAPGIPKDTGRNLAQRGHFVAHIVDDRWAKAIGLCAGDVPPDTSELDVAHLSTEPAVEVEAPRLAGAPVAFECIVDRSLQVGHYTLVLARVVHIHLAESLATEDGFDLSHFEALGHLGLFEFLSQGMGRIPAAHS